MPGANPNDLTVKIFFECSHKDIVGSVASIEEVIGIHVTLVFSNIFILVTHMRGFSSFEMYYLGS